MPTIWFHRPKPRPLSLLHETAHQTALAYSMRVIPLIKPGDLILLPEDESVKTFFNFCRTMLGFHDISAIWMREENPYDDESIIAALHGQDLPIEMGHEIYPYSTSRSCEYLAQKFGLTIKTDSRTWTEIFSNKKILLTLQERGIMIPESYYCETIAELKDAYQKLHDKQKDVLLKPCTSAAGTGIIEILNVSLLDEYTFPFGGVLIQEKMHADRYEDGSPVIPSVQFCSTRIWGVVDQHVHGYAFVGSSYPSQASQSLKEDIITITRRVHEIIQPKGPGGLDFISVQGKPYLIDPNVGRITGVHPIWLFRELYAADKCFHSRSVACSLSIYEFWEELLKAGIAFDFMHKKGVFPLYWFSYRDSKIMFFADTHEELDEMVQKVREIVTRQLI